MGHELDEMVVVGLVLVSGYSSTSVKLKCSAGFGSCSNKGACESSIGDELDRTVVVVGLAMVRSSLVKFRYLASSSSYWSCAGEDSRSKSSTGSLFIVGLVAIHRRVGGSGGCSEARADVRSYLLGCLQLNQ